MFKILSQPYPHNETPRKSIVLSIATGLFIATFLNYFQPFGSANWHDPSKPWILSGFGLVSTLGVNFLYSKQLDAVLILPATAIGFLSVAVLNLNNMRDEASDRKSGKNTLVVKMGIENAKKYHYFLVISAMVLVIAFAYLNDFHFDQYLFVAAYCPLTGHLIRVGKNRNPKLLDPELKKLALSTFFLSILLALSLIYFVSDLLVNYI
jgi:1,4-dihydroxy-2-naphthoate octaprenyltransferase